MNKDDLANKDLNLLNELSSGEDEFDVDLMACGCRLAPSGSGLFLSVDDIIRLYDLDRMKTINFLGALIDESKLKADKIFALAQKTAEKATETAALKKSSRVKAVDFKSAPQMALTVGDIVRLYGMDTREIGEFASNLINEGKIESNRVFNLAEKASKGEMKEPPSKFAADR